MKFQFKKEWLIKYKFWFMLAAIPPAALAALYILESVVAGEIEAKSKTIRDEAKKAGTPLPSPQYNQAGIDTLKKEVERVQKEEANVWKTAYKEQEPLFVMPPGFNAESGFDKGYFAEDIRVFTMSPQKAALPPNTPPPPPDKKAKDAPKIKELAEKKLKDMPPDQAQLVHGRVVDINQREVTIVDRKNNKIRFPKTPMVKVTDPQKKPVHWERIYLNDILTVFFQTGKYFGDPSTEKEQQTWFKYYRHSLPAVLDQLDLLDPVKGDGVVQLGDWSWDKIEQFRTWAKSDDDETQQPPPPSKAFHFLPRLKADKKNDASDDIWIAQENLWIQSEMYRMIRLANDYVAKFDEDKLADDKMSGTFHNSFWDLTLKLGADKKQLTGIFTNRLSRRQKIDLKLRVWTNSSKNAEPEVIEFRQGAPLQPHGIKAGGGFSREVKIDLKAKAARTGIYKVEQVLTWETAAVRRVDGVYIGKMGNANAESHRTFPDPLISYPNRYAPPAPGAANTQPKDKDNKPAAGMAKGGPTPNQQDRSRYLETPEQLRRLPIALVLIVEQGQVDRVQTAFNNSHFRFLTTQVLLNHYPGSMRPPTVEKLPEGTDKGPGGAIGPKDVPMKQPIRLVRGPSGAGVNDEMEVNMEMVIYGIITIYERTPGRAKNPNPS